jgi:hypothetical protein
MTSTLRFGKSPSSSNFAIGMSSWTSGMSSWTSTATGMHETLQSGEAWA